MPNERKQKQQTRNTFCYQLVKLQKNTDSSRLGKVTWKQIGFEL